MDELKRLVGNEYPLREVDLALRRYVGSFHAPVVGAMHVTCVMLNKVGDDPTRYKVGAARGRLQISDA